MVHQLRRLVRRVPCLHGGQRLKKPLSLALAFALAASAPAARAQGGAPADPLTILLTKYSAAPSAKAEGGEKLAAVRADLQLMAGGYEAFRAPEHAERSASAAADKLSPELKPFFKDRDAALNTTYRTLALLDYELASRLPDASCFPKDERDSLLRSSDGLFSNLKTGETSPWLASLLGSQAAGEKASAALERASARTAATGKDYEFLRVKARRLTEALKSERAKGAARAKLLCERADVYENLAAAHGENGPLSAHAAAGDGAAEAASVVLLASPGKKSYQVFGAGALVKTRDGVRLLADASLLRAHKDARAFARPDAGGKLGAPLSVAVERAADGPGAALAKIEPEPSAPPLPLAKTAAAKADLVHTVGPWGGAGAWTVAQGLVTETGPDFIRADAVVLPDQAGSPVLNEKGEIVGLVVMGKSGPAAVSAAKLKDFLAGGAAPAAPDVAPAASGSASLVTAASPFDAAKLVAPGSGAVETGAGSGFALDWDGNGNNLGDWRPQGSAGGRPSAGSSGGMGGGIDMQQVGGAMLGMIGTMMIVQGLSAMAAPSAPAPRAAPAPKRPEPPKKEPLRPVGLTLAARPDAVREGKLVHLTATVLFEGEVGSKSGIAVNFSSSRNGLSFPFGATAVTGAAGEASLDARADEDKSAPRAAPRAAPVEAAPAAPPQIPAPAPAPAAPAVVKTEPLALPPAPAAAPNAKAPAPASVEGFASKAQDDLDREAASVPDESDAGTPQPEPEQAPAPKPEVVSGPAPLVQTGASFQSALLGKKSVEVSARALQFNAGATVRVTPKPTYKLLVSVSPARLGAAGAAVITARIDTNDPDFDVSGRLINFTLTASDGQKATVTATTNADGAAVTTVQVSPSAEEPNVSSTGSGLIETGAGTQAAPPGLCVFAGAITFVTIEAYTTVPSLGTTTPGAMGAGLLITSACTLAVNLTRSGPTVPNTAPSPDNGMTYNKPPKDAKDPNGAKAPGQPGAEEGFENPRSGEQWGRTTNGDWGWVDKNGDIWVPTGKGSTAHGGPHWDVQSPDGRNHRNVYPGGKIR